MGSFLLENIFDSKNWDKVDEYYKTILSKPCFRVEKILSSGHTSPKEQEWFYQEENELVILVDGTAIIEFEDGKTIKMKKGDVLEIRKNEKHKVTYTSSKPECVWVAIFWTD
ncbi:MAG: cupin domain-containing protein [Bacteroidales bacterium]|jgi:cupin 2 domain-containing protein|nr:cupin domain-containing protein [Bacteroidales bacterium]